MELGRLDPEPPPTCTRASTNEPLETGGSHQLSNPLQRIAVEIDGEVLQHAEQHATRQVSHVFMDRLGFPVVLEQHHTDHPQDALASASQQLGRDVGDEARQEVEHDETADE
jgi:hypothetical protein